MDGGQQSSPGDFELNDLTDSEKSETSSNSSSSSGEELLKHSRQNSALRSSLPHKV